MKKLLLLIVILFLAGCVSTDAPDLCDGHNLGDSWNADDGCNTCRCTETGIACTEMACLKNECNTPENCVALDLMHPTCIGSWSCVDGKCAWVCQIEDDFPECQKDDECIEKAKTISRCRSTGKCILDKCVFECIEEENNTSDQITPDVRFDYAEGNCIVPLNCIAAGEGCGGGHSICTNNPEKYKDRITTCDINMNHPTNQGFYCTCIVEQNKCGWKKQ